MKPQILPGTKVKKLFEREYKYLSNEGLQMLEDALISTEAEA
jgi:hypothetical protein